MENDINVENQQLVQPAQSSDTQQLPAVQTQDMAPPAVDVAQAIEAAVRAEREKRQALEDEVRRMQSVVLERALAPAPAPQAVPAADPWASLASTYDPAVINQLRSAVQAETAQRDAEVRQLRAQLGAATVATQAQAYGPEVVALAQAAYDSEVRQGRIPDVGVVTRWAVGEAVLSGKLKPQAAAAVQAAPVQRAPVYAPPNPVVNGAPLPPKRTGLPANFDQLSRAEQVQAVEAIPGADDFSIF